MTETNDDARPFRVHPEVNEDGKRPALVRVQVGQLGFSAVAGLTPDADSIHKVNARELIILLLQAQEMTNKLFEMEIDRLKDEAGAEARLIVIGRA
jgi:hypothetical protein